MPLLGFEPKLLAVEASVLDRARRQGQPFLSLGKKENLGEKKETENKEKSSELLKSLSFTRKHY